MKKVAIILLSFHSEPYLNDAIGALKKVTYPKDQVELVIVDNPHPEHGSSMRYLQEQVLPLSGTELPHITLLPQDHNTGFTGGCNAGLKWATDHGFDYALLTNQDGFLGAGALNKLVEGMEQDPTIGVAQCLILLYPETHLINTSGNAFHYLGLGYCHNFRVPRDQVSLEPISDIGYASGAAMMMRLDLIKQHGGFDDEFFLYHEDLTYSLRLKAIGYRIVLVRDAVFYHKYNFSRRGLKFYYMERNRVGTLLMFFKWRTLILLAPMLCILDLGILLFALKEGWAGNKFRAYGYWLNPKHWNAWIQKRRWIQRIRTRSDRELLADAVSKIVFEEKHINNSLLRSLGNPLMAGYWHLIKPLIRW